jgi:hypothetical protein
MDTTGYEKINIQNFFLKNKATASGVAAPLKCLRPSTHMLVQYLFNPTKDVPLFSFETPFPPHLNKLVSFRINLKGSTKKTSDRRTS